MRMSMDTRPQCPAPHDPYRSRPPAPGGGGPGGGRLATASNCRHLFEWTGIAVAGLDPQLRIVEANTEFWRLVGDGGPDRTGADVLGLVHPSTRDRVRGHFAMLSSGVHDRFSS